MKLAWSYRARNDLVAIFRYIADDDPEAAAKWVKKLRARAVAAARVPRAGRWLPEHPERKNVREVLLKGYRIVYVVGEKTVTVLTVFEGHRRLPSDV